MKKVIFDVDGVLFSEERYYDVSGLTVWEILFGKDYMGLATEAEDFDAAKVTDGQIAAIRSRVYGKETLFEWLKNHGINSNWDMVHAALVTMIALMGETYRLRTGGDFLPIFCEKEQDVKRMGAELMGLPIPRAEEVLAYWERHVPKDALGQAVFLKLSESMETIFGEIPEWSKIGSAFWQIHVDAFQAWYLGDDEFIRQKGRVPFCPGKAGFLKSEIPLAPKDAICALFQRLKTKGFEIAVATGRTRNEAEIPFCANGWLKEFDPLYLATSTDAQEAGKLLGVAAPDKPHPFLYECAMYGRKPELYASYLSGEKKPETDDIVYVIGDSYADILGSRAAGAQCIGVLTGLEGKRASVMWEKEKIPYVERVTDIESVIFGE